MILNITLALTSVGYWYVTGNWWYAAIGIVAATIYSDELFLLVILLTALIGYIGIYFIWKDAATYLKQENLSVLYVTFLYVAVACATAVKAFRG